MAVDAPLKEPVGGAVEVPFAVGEVSEVGAALWMELVELDPGDGAGSLLEPLFFDCAREIYCLSRS